MANEENNKASSENDMVPPATWSKRYRKEPEQYNPTTVKSYVQNNIPRTGLDQKKLDAKTEIFKW